MKRCLSGTLGLLLFLGSLNALAVPLSVDSCRQMLKQNVWPTVKEFVSRVNSRDTLLQQLLFSPALKSKPLKKDLTRLQRAAQWGIDAGVFTLRSVAHILSPIDIRVVSRPESYALFRRLETDAAWRLSVVNNEDWLSTLSISEMKIASEIKDFSSYYRRRAQYLTDYPLAFKGAKGLGYGIKGLRYALYASGIALVVIEGIDGLVTVDELLDAPEQALKDDQIQLINETLPFPHLAIRIGNQVYSYGTAQITVAPARLYLDEVLAHQMAGKNPGWLSRNRSIHVVTLNLSKEEVLSLKRHLELQNGKLYRNLTLINDCSSMAVRAIEESTHYRLGKSVIDASPTAILELLSLRKISGDPSVARIQLIKTDKQQSSPALLARAAWMSILEGRLFYETYLLNQSIRGVFDHHYGTENIQKYGDLLKGQIVSIRKEVITEYEDDPQMEVFFRKKAALKTSEKKDYNSLVSEYIGKLRGTQLAILSDKNSEFYQIYESGYRVLALDDIERRLTGNKSIDSRNELKKRVDSPDFVDFVLGDKDSN